MTNDDSTHLAAYRAGSAAWAELACADGQDDDGLWTDPHAPARARALLALQYDRRPEDRPLVTFLFDHEVQRHTREPYAGLHEALERAAFLLAVARDPTDSLRFWRAKLANFDTYCGLDVRYLVVAGLDPTVTFLSTVADDPEGAAILSFLELYDPIRFTPGALDAWWRETEQRFPAALAAESPQARLHRALDAGDVDDARHWLEAWEAGDTPTHAILSELVGYWEALGDFARASTLQRRVIASVPDSDFAVLTRFVASCKLAELLRCHGDFPAAWQTLLEAEQLHGHEPEWMAESARRDLAWEAIRLAGTVPHDDPLGPRAFTWAIELIARGCPLSVALLEDGRAVATRLGDERAVAWLDAILVQMREPTLDEGAESDAAADE